jgi:aldose 1-epimerase
MPKFICLLLFVSLVFSCQQKRETTEAPADHSTPTADTMVKESFGKLPDGREVYRYTLKNKNGIEMQVINYGGIVTSLKVPDKNGHGEDIVLGYDSLSDYVRSNPYFGALIGRYGNRIAGGKFKLEGNEYTLAQNNNGQHLHGGVKGFDKVFWDIEEQQSNDGQALKLTYVSEDMEEGYPGRLSVTVLYTLRDNNEWHIAYSATTDKATVVNLTQHTYFNLTGNVKRDILDHVLMLAADRFLPVDQYLIPTGQLQPVKGIPFDFTTPTAIGARINDNHPQLKVGKGYDHCWVLSAPNDPKRLAATLFDPSSGRFMEVYTTEPGIQFYSGNFLDGSNKGKNGVVYQHRYGLCLETQHFPDSPNRPAFPSVVLKPGEEYKTETTYKFSVK